VVTSSHHSGCRFHTARQAATRVPIALVAGTLAPAAKRRNKAICRYSVPWPSRVLVAALIGWMIAVHIQVTRIST
jgi:hypothetical protein